MAAAGLNRLGRQSARRLDPTKVDPEEVGGASLLTDRRTHLFAAFLVATGDKDVGAAAGKGNRCGPEPPQVCTASF